MKRATWIFILFLMVSGITVTESCKNKKNETTQENKTNDATNTAPVEINSDAELRTSVDVVVKDYDGVQADVNDGVVTLRGNIKEEDLQNLIMRIQELKPKKVENQIVIKVKK